MRGTAEGQGCNPVHQGYGPMHPACDPATSRLHHMCQVRGRALPPIHPPLSTTPGAGQDCGARRATRCTGGGAATAAACGAFRPATGMAAGGGPDHWHRSPQESGPLGYTSPLGRVTSRLGSTARPPWTNPLGAGLLSTFRGCIVQISVRGCGAASAHARVSAFSLLATYLPPRRHLLLQPHHPCDAVDQAHLGLRGGLAPPLRLTY